MSKFLAFVKSAAQNPVSIPLIVPVDDALELRVYLPGDDKTPDVATVACNVYHGIDEVNQFVEHRTRLDRWIVKVGFPQVRRGIWIWTFIKVK
jgi:hypothetical protein